MDKIGSYSVPTILFLIVLFGFCRKVPVFDAFIQGAKEGMKSTASIAPTLVGLIVSVSMLKASGALDLLTSFISPVTDFLHIPSIIVPLGILRPISGSGSMAFLDTIFKTHGPDSFVGRVASVLMGSSETTFYAIAVYFGAVGIKHTRHTIPAAICADIVGFIMSVFTVRLLFY